MDFIYGHTADDNFVYSIDGLYVVETWPGSEEKKKEIERPAGEREVFRKLVLVHKRTAYRGKPIRI